MTQHTPKNRNTNNTTSTNMSYTHKVRGTHTRVSRVRVTTVGKSSFPEKQHRSCPRCKDSTNSMKILNERVGKIEQLVDVLAKTTRGLASISKRDERFVQNTLKFRGIDLTRCTLEELQKLVVTTTNIMVPSNTNNNTTNTTNTTNILPNNKKSNIIINPSTNLPKDNTLSDITIPTNNEKKIFSEPTPMEDIKTISTRDRSSQRPIHPALGSLKFSLRQDSGFAESEPPLKPSVG
uniref:Uncharacterized protein MAL13P1.304 n=1 Tax=Anthurium amnicola TaxID=1678845 RepID=A0A1D1Z3J8_9ARAE